MQSKTLLGILLICVRLSSIYAQSSAFTYQGLLFDNSQPANAVFDLQFRLTDAATNGNQVGAIITQLGVPVSNGVFGVTLDFGGGLFNGSARWLEVAVRTNQSQGQYTVLRPSQPITSAPYAAFATSAATAGLASNLVAGAVLTNLSIPGSSIQPGTITATQMDPATDALYRKIDTNVITAIIGTTPLTILGGSIEPGTITAIQMDPTTDAAYRNVDTNAVTAIVATASANFATSAGTASLASNLVAGAVLTNISVYGGSVQPGTITAIQIDPATDAAYRTVNTNAITAIVATASANFASSAATAGLASNLVAGAILNNVSIYGGSVQPGTITATQIDPDTDAAYRTVNTNAITAIVATASANFAASAATAGIASNLVAGVVGTNLSCLDVKQTFGVIGDGISDDTAAIQSALNYLATDSASNLTLYFPPGTYKVLNTLSVPPNSFPIAPVLGNNSGYRITGAGLSATKLVWPSLGSGMGLALTNVGAGYEGFTIENLTLVGPLMTSWDPANASIGLAIGKYGADTGYSGRNNTVRNCGIIGWGYAAAVTNQWVILFDNCIVTSNNIEGLRFAGSHGVSVQNCWIGGGWATACGLGIGFHPPLNLGFGDNAQIINCMIGNCTNGILNNELNLLSLNTHLEGCGSYYTLVNTTGGSPTTTIIGGYTLDYSFPWANGCAAQILMDPPAAATTVIENCSFTSSFYPGRPIFNVTNDGSGYTMPTYVGNYPLPGLWDTTSNVTLYPFGKTPQPLWTYQLPLKNGPDFTSGITAAQSPDPWDVAGAMEVASGSVGALEFAIPHAMGFSNLVLELTVQGVAGETNMAFGIREDNYSIGPAGPQKYGGVSATFSGITNGSTSTFYWVNSFGEDLYPRRCHYTLTSYDTFLAGVTNDLWILSWRLLSMETSLK